MRAAAAFARALIAHDAFEVAGSIAYWFFLSLVPLLVIFGYVVARVARTRGMDELLAPLFDVVPPTAEGLFRKEIERLDGADASSVAPLGLAGFLWTASSGLHNLMDVFERAVHASRRAWWKQRAIALAWVVLGLGAACLLAWVLLKADVAMHAHDAALKPAAAHARGVLPRRVHKALQTPHEQILAAGLLLITGVSLLAGFYRFAVVHPPGFRRRVWPGAIAAVASWLVVSWAFGAYAVSIADYAVYYGGLAAVAVLLVWLYLTSLSLIVGAEVNAQLEGVRSRRVS